MRCHVHNDGNQVTLIGTHNEFEPGAHEAAKEMGLDMSMDGGVMAITGSWEDMAALTGVGDVRSLNDFTQAIKKKMPQIEVTLDQPGTNSERHLRHRRYAPGMGNEPTY